MMVVVVCIGHDLMRPTALLKCGGESVYTWAAAADFDAFVNDSKASLCTPRDRKSAIKKSRRHHRSTHIMKQKKSVETLIMSPVMQKILLLQCLARQWVIDCGTLNS